MMYHCDIWCNVYPNQLVTILGIVEFINLYGYVNVIHLDSNFINLVSES